MSSLDFEFLNRNGRLVGSAEDLTPEIAATLGALFGEYIGGEDAVVVTARDYRKDTRMVSRAFNAGLISVGTTVFELHSCSFPVLEFALRRFSAHAGVQFAATHRQPSKIAIRFFNQTGVEIPSNEIYKGEKLQSPKIKRAPPSKIADIVSVQQANELYQAAVRSALNLDIFEAKKITVVVDCALGPVAEAYPALLSSVGIDVLTLNSYVPSSIPESLPSPKSLAIMSRTIIAAKADMGIAFDSKGSRVLFFDETGKIIDAHAILAMLIEQKMVGREEGTVVFSKSLWLLNDWLKSKNIKAYFVEDYPGNISKTMQFHRSLFGGNERGNYIHPTFSNESEPFVTALLILRELAQNGRFKYLSQLIEQYDVVNHAYLKEELYYPLNQPVEFFTKLYEQKLEYKKINTLNGIKIIFSDKSWAHLSTRLIPQRLYIQACAEEKEEREKILEYCKALIEKIELN
ncbi:MAG: hypothetical protein ACTSYD_13885 [Candidatus Heimdallarchaeaceae archaeon]